MQYASLREKIAAEKVSRMEKYAKFNDIIEQALQAGEKAGIECCPIPMGVSTSDGKLIE